MDSKAVEDLFVRFYKPVRTVLQKHCSVPRPYLDDLAQEVFLRLLRYPNSQITGSVSGYVFTIATHVAIEWKKLKGNSVPRDALWLEDLMVDERQETHNIHETEDTNRKIQSIIDRMPERRRSIILLYSQGDLTYNELAVELNISERIVLRELVKAYAKLKEEFFK